MAEIYARPYMDPMLAEHGNRPESNKILDAENLLIDSKTVKLNELMKQSTEIHDIVEKAKTDYHM